MDDVRLDISGISEKDGKKRACVRFTRGADCAEGYIPDCTLTKVEGFTEKEAEQLAAYLRDNLVMLKRKAASVNPLNAIMGKKEE